MTRFLSFLMQLRSGWAWWMGNLSSTACKQSLPLNAVLWGEEPDKGHNCLILLQQIAGFLKKQTGQLRWYWPWMGMVTDSGVSIWIVAGPLLQVCCYSEPWANLGLITARLKWLNIDRCLLCSAACWLCQRAAVLSAYICITHIYGLNIFYLGVGNMSAALFSLLFSDRRTSH